MMKLRFSFLFLICCFSTIGIAQELENSRPANFPTPPSTEKSLFFIQRNKNVNTIMYDAKFLTNGDFDKSEPIDAYWLRYTSTGYRKELSWLERTFAYGYNSKRDKGGNGHWVELTAYDGRKIHLKKSDDNKPIATISCNGKDCKLDYIYVYADESSSWPKVIHIDIHATELDTGISQVERIFNN